MKLMIKSALAAMLMLACVVAHAQPGPRRAGAPPTPDRERIAQELQLTPQQETKFFAAMEKFQSQLQALRADTSLEPMQRRTKMQELTEAQRKEMQSILTKEQMEKWTAMRQERMEQGPAQRPAQPAPRGPLMQGNREDNNPLAKEIAEYNQSEIMPVLRSERAKLEKKLSRKDSEMLASFRTQVKAMGPGGSNRQVPGGSNRAKSQQKAELDRMAKKYGKDIDRIFAGLEPQVNRWNKDLQAIHEKYGKTEKSTGKANPLRRPVPKATDLLTPVRFLLLEPAA